MSSTQTISLNNNTTNHQLLISVYQNDIQTSVNISNIPTVSESTKEIFNRLDVNKANYFHSENNLKSRAATLEETIKNLQKAQQNEIRDKIFGLLRSAITIGIAVGGTFGILAATSPFGLGFAIVLTFIAYSCMCAYNYYQIDPYLPGGAGAAFIVWFAGPFAPLFEVFGKIGKLEKDVENQKQQIKDEFLQIAKRFNENKAEIQKLIAAEIEKTKQAMNAADAAEADAQEMLVKQKTYGVDLAKLELALAELDKAIKYYSRFE